jgi:hypothetical protein
MTWTNKRGEKKRKLVEVRNGIKGRKGIRECCNIKGDKIKLSL